MRGATGAAALIIPSGLVVVVLAGAVAARRRWWFSAGSPWQRWRRLAQIAGGRVARSQVGCVSPGRQIESYGRPRASRARAISEHGAWFKAALTGATRGEGTAGTAGTAGCGPRQGRAGQAAGLAGRSTRLASASHRRRRGRRLDDGMRGCEDLEARNPAAHVLQPADQRPSSRPAGSLAAMAAPAARCAALHRAPAGPLCHQPASLAARCPPAPNPRPRCAGDCFPEPSRRELLSRACKGRLREVWSLVGVAAPKERDALSAAYARSFPDSLPPRCLSSLPALPCRLPPVTVSGSEALSCNHPCAPPFPPPFAAISHLPPLPHRAPVSSLPSALP